MRGAYAFGILFDDRPGEVWVIRRGSPLILAKGQDGFYLASDMTALLPFTKQYCAMEEGEIACLTPEHTLLMREDGSTQMIRRAETKEDYFATLDLSAFEK